MRLLKFFFFFFFFFFFIIIIIIIPALLTDPAKDPFDPTTLRPRREREGGRRGGEGYCPNWDSIPQPLDPKPCSCVFTTLPLGHYT